MQTDWLSLHIFWNQYPVKLLVEVISPLTDALQQEGLIDKFFFIRYWQGGDHIRLRLALRPGVDRETVKTRAMEPLAAFLNRFPSRFEVDPETAEETQWILQKMEYQDAPSDLQLYPNNSIQDIPYEREWDRYAGEQGMLVSEEQFYYSSKLALGLLPGVNWHMRSIILGQAFQIMLITAQSFRLSLDEGIDFFTGYVNFWTAFKDPRNKLSPTTFLELVDEQYDRYPGRSLAQFQSVQNSLKVDGPVDEGNLLSWWYQHHHRIYEKLGKLEEAQLLTIPDHGLKWRNARQYLLCSYLHMTNNRLGILPTDEIYLGQFCRRVLQERRAQEGSNGAI